MLAMEMANKLIQAHPDIDIDIADPTSPPTWTSQTFNEKTTDYTGLLLFAIKLIYPVHSKYTSYGVVFFGDPAFIDAAHHTYTYLIETIERAYKAALPKNLTQSNRAKFRKNFKPHMAATIQDRIRAMTNNNRSLITPKFSEWLNSQGVSTSSGKRSLKPGFGAGEGTLAGKSAIISPTFNNSRKLLS